ncbi:secretion-regulating guanine nucleotide exchange factor [Oratosquilla oratoria]|uniref:secretion-regulating guanine nucleotide exchange factor n=1 Tax=Oratosquilla oratoria TaxID=337810 RepID=UPI003F7612CB
MTALYAWGANSHGQLGLGFVSEQVTTPVRVEDLPDNLSESSICRVSGGGGHTFILTSSGKLFGSGWNSSGQVGDGTQGRAVATFQQIRGLEGQHMVGVACGWAHSVAFSRGGKVWVWGCNTHGQLGIPKEEVPFTSLPICLDISNVVSVGAGLRHTAVTTRDGRVYTWGHGHRGQLGHLDSDGKMVKIQNVPRVVDHLQGKASMVVCGQNTTYALTTDGRVLAWGDNKWGQLAHDPRNVAFFACPIPIPPNYFGAEKVTFLRSGWTHCIAKTVSGVMYVWGRSCYGQLGPAEDDEDSTSDDAAKTSQCRFIPGMLSIGKEVQDIQCGSEHNLALVGEEGEAGVLYTWGWNEHGNCGDGTTINILKPTQLAVPGSVGLAGAGSGHSFALAKLF